MMRAGLSASAIRVLDLLAHCSHVPVDVITVLTFAGHAVSTYQLLGRLRTAGLVQHRQVSPSPLVGTRPVGVWSLTKEGWSRLQTDGPVSDTLQHPLSRTPDRISLADPGRLIVIYSLLAALVAEAAHNGKCLQVAGWEQPCVRSFGPERNGHMHHLRLPGAAAMFSEEGSSRPAGRPVLLLPDLGTASVMSYRPLLHRLHEFRARCSDSEQPVLIVATLDRAASGSRIEAWRELLRRAAVRTAEPQLAARVLSWQQLSMVAPGIRFLAHYAGSQDDQQLATTRDLPHADQVLGLVSRHPCLSREQLATLVGVSRARIANLQQGLLDDGLIQPISADAFPGHKPALHGLRAVEPTARGRRAAARQLLLPRALATRQHGLLDGGSGAARQLLRRLQHTAGVNAVFVALVWAARMGRALGGNDALEEWRCAAACARGRCRPDGYGYYRRGSERFGFFLEYDRGTERPREYAAKLRAYYHYRDSGSAARDYVGFPTVLVVSTSDRAEELIAWEAHLAAQRHSGNPLLLLLTTTRLIRSDAEGILGPIWRASGPAQGASEPRRGYWLPGRPPRGIRATLRPGPVRHLRRVTTRSGVGDGL